MNIQLPKKKNGFTLIELLVVMTIIAIIATLGITAYLNAMRNTRNAKNISNVNAMQSAFEQYYGINGVYAACATMGASLQGGLPVSASTTAYISSCAAASYCICSNLEGDTDDTNVKGGNASDDDCGAGDWISDGTAAFYCVANKQ